MADTIDQLFADLSADVRYLLGKKVEAGNWDCSECACQLIAKGFHTPTAALSCSTTRLAVGERKEATAT
jgi:hypothetical protein